MQVWTDDALEARLPPTASGAAALPSSLAAADVVRSGDAVRSAAVSIRGADPLARRALANALAFAGFEDVHDGAVVSLAAPADVVLYDDGPAPPPGALRPTPDAEEPWLALVASGPRAKAALANGFRGALGRDAAPEVLAAAIGALRHGLVTIDPRFAAETLPAPAPAIAPLALTPREHQVLELLAEGLSNKEIGAQLGVSPHTAKFHVTALLDKLGAETRTEAVVLAARSGLLDL